MSTLLVSVDENVDGPFPHDIISQSKCKCHYNKNIMTLLYFNFYNIYYDYKFNKHLITNKMNIKYNNFI